MPKRSVLAFGFELPDIEGFETASIFSDRSLLDADIIAIELSISDLHSHETYNGLPVFTKSSSFKFREAKQRWISQVQTALSAGKTVVFFLTEREGAYYYTGNRDVSGTGRNQKITEHVVQISNYDFLPVELKNPNFARGKSITLSPSSDLLSEFWHQFSEMLVYNCYFETQKAKPLITTKSGNHVVGSVATHEGGALFLLPEINWESISTYEIDDSGGEIVDEDGYLIWSEDLKSFTARLRNALLDIDTQVRMGSEETTPPEWSETPEYRLLVEAELEADIIEIGSRIKELEGQQANRRAELRAKSALRNLLFEKGPILESAVRQALELLGFNVEHFKDEDSEFDALFTSEHGRFIGEVEGKDNKAINVDKLSQLQRNIAEDFARDEVGELATGVLFGNAYRLTFPVKRAEFFTDKVRLAAKVANIALVRTTDLFAVAQFLENSNDIEFAKRCRESIRKDVGDIVSFPEIPESSHG